MKHYLGVDTGSVSINFAIINEKKEIVETLYLRNRGVIETIQEGLKLLKKKKISGVGITGSGRTLTNALVGGDVVKTEILAHSMATIHFYPEVSTIMEIGGEDSKLMIIKDKILVNYAMNNQCSGGTGAMIEAIAGRMEIPIEKVGRLALKHKSEINLPGKCGIFAQSAVVSHLNSGAKKEDLLWGVCRALISNYLYMLSQGKDLKPPYVFQGGVALNKAVVVALEQELGEKVMIPKYCSVMGAIGMALLAIGMDKTNFKGFNIKDNNFRMNRFYCDDCSNKCEILEVREYKKSWRSIAAWGSKCGKWNK